VLAALDHPHIATIHGVEESDPATNAGLPVKALVLALVEGETLAGRVSRGPLSIADALEYARSRQASSECSTSGSRRQRVRLKPDTTFASRVEPTKDDEFITLIPAKQNLPVNPQLHMVLNWFQDLEHRLSQGN
jgi:hypothetical protein